jgi:hypothetical protein
MGSTVRIRLAAPGKKLEKPVFIGVPGFFVCFCINDISG